MIKSNIYDSCLVICHGKSEFIFIKSLRSNLKLKFAVYAKKNGNQSIQITGLDTLLNSKDFKTLKDFKRKYLINTYKNKIIDFKVFIVMDFDEKEYTDEIKENFINKSMFKNHFLSDYIVPVYNDGNFDKVLIHAGYNIDVNNKVKSYIELFPAKNGDFEEFLEIKRNIDKVSSDKTNIKLLFDYLESMYLKKQ